MSELEKYQKQLAKIEKELDKCRTSVLDDGWQTQRYAKKARKWDYYAELKRNVQNLIETEKEIIKTELFK